MREVSGRPFVHNRWVALRKTRNLINTSNRIIIGFLNSRAHFNIDEGVAIFGEDRAHITFLRVLNILRKSAQRRTHTYAPDRH